MYMDSNNDNQWTNKSRTVLVFLRKGEMRRNDDDGETDVLMLLRDDFLEYLRFFKLVFDGQLITKHSIHFLQ